jgi:PH (Pleckstrin Homology) domain-containing protein
MRARYRTRAWMVTFFVCLALVVPWPIAAVSLIPWFPLAVAVDCVIIGVTLYAVYRAWRAGATPTDEGMQIRGFIRDRTVPWADIATFIDGGYYVRVVYNDGRSRQITGVQVNTMGPNTRFGRTLTEMQTELARRHGLPTPPEVIAKRMPIPWHMVLVDIITAAIDNIGHH